MRSSSFCRERPLWRSAHGRAARKARNATEGVPYRRFATLLLCATCLFSASAAADEIDDHLAAVTRCGRNGAGQAQARAARDALAGCGVDVLPRLLAAMDTDNPVALNWYRTALDEIVARERARPQPKLPLEAFRAVVGDAGHNGRVRRHVLRLLDDLDPQFGPQVIPTLLDDPEFRADAVEAALVAGQAAAADDRRHEALAAFHRAFDHAREPGQVTRAAAQLRDLGQPADVVAHFGFVVDWWLVGPFPAPEYTGFDLVLPPQEAGAFDAATTFSTSDRRTLTWRRHCTADEMGTVNLNDAIGPAAGAVGYAYAELESPDERPAQLRAGADDNLTVWLNGHEVLARRQWLNGTRLDRFIVPVRLRAGRNTLLVKVCQGPQHKDPAVPNNWSLQMRLCDETGAGLPLRSLLPATQ